MGRKRLGNFIPGKFPLVSFNRPNNLDTIDFENGCSLWGKIFFEIIETDFLSFLLIKSL